MDSRNSQLSPILLERASSLRQHYFEALFGDVVPWWEKYSIDDQFGGYHTRLERDGHVYAEDKDMWSTGRQIWFFSHIYNHHEKNQRWLDIAATGADFATKHAMREDGKMHFRLTRDGRSTADCLSVYTESFMAIAMAELSMARNDRDMWRRAVAMYDRIMPRLGTPSNTPMLGYPLNAEFHLHAHDMIRMNVSWVFNEMSNEQQFQADLDKSVNSIINRHWKPELSVLFENVAMDGQPMLDLPEGRLFHPGHASESAWMLMEIATMRGDRELIDTAAEIAIAAFEFGWDEQYGGLRYLTNCDRTPTHELEADMKLWWPHSESLYTALLGWVLTGRDDLRKWYEKFHEYTFDVFPDKEHGEWFGYLNRDGSPTFTAKANGWKACFHTPRSLYRCYQLLSNVVELDSSETAQTQLVHDVLRKRFTTQVNRKSQ